MAITIPATTSGPGNTTTSFTITLPTTQANDLIIVEYTHRGTADGTITGTYSGPALTRKHERLYASSAFSGKTWWSRATGNHSGQTIIFSGLTDSCAGICTIYRGAVTSGDPLAAATIVGEENASGDETQAQITTTVGGAWVVLVVANSPDVAVTAQACTSPTLVARVEKLSTGGTDASISHASGEKATAGATGAFTWAQTNGASGSWAYAIEPAPVLASLAATEPIDTAAVEGVVAMPVSSLWRPLYASAPMVAESVRARTPAGQIGQPGPGLPGFARLRPTFRQTDDRVPPAAEAGAVTGSLAATEAPDVLEVAGDVIVQGSITATDAPDVLAATVDVIVQGPLAVTDAPDVFAAAGDVIVQGALAATDTKDILAATGDVIVQGTLAAAEAPDVLAATGDVIVQGPLAVTDAPDVLAAAGDVIVQGALAATETADILAATGTVTTSGVVTGSLAATDAPDVLAGAGDVLVQGPLAATDAPDVLGAAADVIVQGALAVTEAADVLAATGTVGSVATGILAATDAVDVAALAGDVLVQGPLAVADAQDVLAATGGVIVQGGLAAAEALDSLAASGTVTDGVTGVLAATDAPDVFAAAGDVIVQGALAATEAKDLFAATNVPPTATRPTWGGGLRPPTPKPKPKRHVYLGRVLASAAVVSRVRFDPASPELVVPSADEAIQQFATAGRVGARVRVSAVVAYQDHSAEMIAEDNLLIALLVR